MHETFLTTFFMVMIVAAPNRTTVSKMQAQRLLGVPKGLPTCNCLRIFLFGNILWLIEELYVYGFCNGFSLRLGDDSSMMPA